jgi:DNA repair protein RecO (recombination protein O)
MQLSSDAVILRVWPVNEADLIVSFLTRDFGKLKGVAKSALKSRRRFGGALEMMTEVRATFADRPRQDLVRIDHFDLITSPLRTPVDYARMTALSFYVEVMEQALPDRNPEEVAFRLMTTVLNHSAAGQFWPSITYFSLWMTRLMGWLPDLHVCTVCSSSVLESGAWFHPSADGLLCRLHAMSASAPLSPESLHLAQRMLRSPIAEFAVQPWSAQRGADLRRFAIQSLERHLERRLRTAEALRRLATSVVPHSETSLATTLE